MERLEKFRGYREHAWLFKVYAKLNKKDIEFCEQFIQENSALSQNEFVMKVQRMYLDREKPKNFSHIMELLTCCNS